MPCPAGGVLICVVREKTMRLDKLRQGSGGTRAGQARPKSTPTREVTPEHVLRALLTHSEGVALTVLRKVGAIRGPECAKLDEALRPTNAGSRRHGRGLRGPSHEGPARTRRTRQSDEFKDEYVSSEQPAAGAAFQGSGRGFARTARGGRGPRHGSQSPGRGTPVASGSPTPVRPNSG